MANIVDLRNPKTENPKIEKPRKEEIYKLPKIDTPELSKSEIPKLSDQKALPKAEPKIELRETNPLPSEDISWEIPPTNIQKKFLIIIILALLIPAALLIFFRYDILLAVVLILGSTVLALDSTKKKPAIKVLINKTGVTVNETTHYYRDLKSFWIEYQPREIKELSLESQKWYVPYIKLPMTQENPLEIRKILIEYLPEKKHEQSIIDLIIKRVSS